MADKPTEPGSTPDEKPSRDTPWRHQDGCTNPNSTDRDCPCGPEVIPE